jgi:hypothetical protein
MSPDYYRPKNDDELRTALQAKNMIRERDISEYATCLDVPFEDLATETVRKKGSFVWYDMCCGDFLAAETLLYNLYNRTEEVRTIVRPNVHAVGIDVDTIFADDYKKSRNVLIRRANAVTYPLPPDIDLLTSYRGLQYIEQFLGMGLQAIENWYNALSVGSILSVDISGHPKLESPKVIDFLNNRFGDDSIKYPSEYINNWYATVFKVVKPDTERLIIPK